jgi:phosphatidylglycerol:prolipoprotein diacylglycerol transferase
MGASLHDSGLSTSAFDATIGRLRELREEFGVHSVAVSQQLDRLGDRVILFRIGNLLFVTFGLFAALGALATLFGAGVILIGQGMSASSYLAMGGVSCVTVVAGSWAVAQALDFRLVLKSPRVMLMRPVFASWGGILLLPFVFAGFARITGLDTLVLLDAVCRTILIGHAIGRLGCLSYGCCFGRPTTHRLAITYHNPAAKAVRVADLHGVPLHPAAFYEASMDLAIFLLVNLAAAAGAPIGIPSALTFLFYGIGRFAIEFVKDNHGRMLFGPIALNHIICVATSAAGLLMLRAVLAGPEVPPQTSWSVGLATLLEAWPAMLSAVAVVFVGFSLHRHRVGGW